jgi:hypothetical protein
LKSEVGDVRQTFAGLIKRGFQEKVLSCDGILPDSNSIASGKVVADLKYGKNWTAGGGLLCLDERVQIEHSSC